MALNPRHRMVGEAYNQGETIEALMKRFQVQRLTILDHLAKYALEGHPLRSGDDLLSLLDLTDREQAAALQAFEALGTEYLKPVFDQLDGAVSYDDLKILRLHYLSRREDRGALPREKAD